MATNPITFSGFNGIDFNQIIEAIMLQESQPLTNLQGQQKAHQDKDGAYVELGAQVSRIQSAVRSLVDGTAFNSVTASSSDTSVVKTSVGASAIEGRYEIEVTALARAQVTVSSNGYAATSEVVANGGSISFTIGGETTEPITITADTTLTELRDQINAQDSGVVASIVNTGVEYHLVISSRETGSTNGFVINNSLTNGGGAVVAFAAGQNETTGNTQNAQNAAFTMNGIAITSASNSVSTAAPGLTIALSKTGSAVVEAVANRDALKDAVKTLVSEFNKLKQFYDRAQKRDANAELTPLANDAILRQIYSEIRRVLLGANDNGGELDYLAEIGIEFASNGELKFVELRFNEAVDTRLSDVQQLFQGSGGTGGLFRDLQTRLTSLDATSGVVKTARTSLELTLQRDEDRVDAMQLRLDLRRQELVKIYAAADEAMSRMNQSLTSLSSISGRLF